MIKGWTRIWSVAGAMLVLGLLAVTGGAATGAQARILTDDFTELAERLSPSVVNIATTRGGGTGQGFGAPGGPVRSLGSGFIIDPSGVIVTNNHVVRNATNIRVYMTDGTLLEAEVIGRDSQTDIAILKVDAGRRLPAVTFGNSDEAEVGSWALAIGNPFGFGGTVTLGIVSARDRSIKGRDPGSSSNRPQYFDLFIQTDAAINSGNSGGPLFNTKGEVIGINTAIISPTNANVGLAFAIPSSFAKIVVDQIREFGRTRLGYLGVSIQVVDDDTAAQVSLPRPRGVLITRVQPGSPAQRAGLVLNDVILTYGPTRIDTLRSLPRVVARTPVGTVVPMRIWRGGGEITLDVTIDALPAGPGQRISIAPPEPERFSSLGVTLSELSLPMRIQHGIHGANDGLLVVDVDAGSPIAGRVKPGDLITDVYGWPVKTINEMKTRVGEAEKSDLGALLVKINRKDDTLFEAVTMTR